MIFISVREQTGVGGASSDALRRQETLDFSECQSRYVLDILSRGEAAAAFSGLCQRELDVIDGNACQMENLNKSCANLFWDVCRSEGRQQAVREPPTLGTSFRYV